MIACQSKKFDVVIRGATVYDGSGADSVVTDVGINADTIAELGDLSSAEAKVVYDGKGKVLAPGFIDTHSHHDRGLQKDRGGLAVVSQGVTTVVVGQDGGSSTPLKEYYQLLSDSPVAVNVASYTGHNTIRDMVLGEDFKRTATQEEIDSMLTIMKADMEAGALGLSTGLEYDPGIYSAKDEVLFLSKALPAYNGRYISHMRSEDRYFWDALNEIITIGKEAKIPVQISHFKLAMTNLWGKADSTIGILDKARADGVDITADIYPYAYWSSTIRVLFPSRNFKDVKEAEMILKEITTPEGIIFSNYDPNPEYNGKSLLEVSQQLKLSPAKTLVELIDRLEKCDAKGGDCGGSIVATSMAEADIARLMQWSHTSICSDGASSGRHPRGYGAFTRVLKFYVREQKVLTMSEAIHKMTLLAAQNLGINKRGKIQKGYYADLVLFDPATVGDQSTIANPQALSTGIEHVWVNGVEVYSDNHTSGNYPGTVIRRGDK